MSQASYRVFEEVEVRAQLLGQYWHNFQAEITKHLPDSYHPEIQELSSKLEKALITLIEKLRQPTLILATTGTTSSGKSTLINLLCGAEIVPMAVSEMSAGAVTIEYSQNKSLIIEKTPGALWESGEWSNISDEEIYQRLHQVMISYIDNRAKQPHLACPQSLIYYPFQLFDKLSHQLPKGVKVKLLDLPGLSYVGDAGNLSVIKQCRQALCLVTYNSEENDPQKTRSLLLEVVDQVKDLGGSPARMLFILNRIDAFRSDNNWPESEMRFVENTIKNIKAELIEQLGEYTQEIENLKIIKLSTWSALLSLQIQSLDENYSTIACEKADKNFNGLIEANILEDLPRKHSNWTKQDKQRVADDLWKKSYAEEFEEYLMEHITLHFPKLVIPQALDEFNVAAGNSIVEWAVQTTTAIVNSSQEQYNQECENIKYIRECLEKFLQENHANLKKPFVQIDEKIKQAINEESEDDPILFLEDTLKELQKVPPYNELGEKLSALYQWRRALGKGIQQVLGVVAKSIESGKVNLESTNLKKVDFSKVKLLENNLNRLINLGYTGNLAKNGETREAKTEAEKKSLKQLNQELNELSIHLNIIMEDILGQIVNQEKARMYEAVSELFDCHIVHLETGAHSIAPNIAIKFPESQIKQVTGSLGDFNLNFESGFVITDGTWQESVIVETEKRVWYHWLWLAPKKIKEITYETRSSDNAQIPSTEELLDNWNIQVKIAEPTLVNQIGEWLLEQIDCLNKKIDDIQTDVIDRYQSRLDTAYQKITFDYEKQKNIWEPMQEQAKNLSTEFSQLKFEDGGTD